MNTKLYKLKLPLASLLFGLSQSSPALALEPVSLQRPIERQDAVGISRAYNSDSPRTYRTEVNPNFERYARDLARDAQRFNESLHRSHRHSSPQLSRAAQDFARHSRHFAEDIECGRYNQRHSDRHLSQLRRKARSIQAVLYRDTHTPKKSRRHWRNVERRMYQLDHEPYYHSISFHPREGLGSPRYDHRKEIRNKHRPNYYKPREKGRYNYY